MQVQNGFTIVPKRTVIRHTAVLVFRAAVMERKEKLKRILVLFALFIPIKTLYHTKSGNAQKCGIIHFEKIGSKTCGGECDVLCYGEKHTGPHHCGICNNNF